MNKWGYKRPVSFFLLYGFLLLSINHLSFAATEEKIFSPENEGFSVNFLGTPQKKSFPDTSWSTNIVSYCRDTGRVALCVSHQDLTKSVVEKLSAEEVLLQLRNSAGNKNKAKITYEKNFKFEKFGTKDLIYTNAENNQQRIWIIVAEKRIFMLVASSLGINPVNLLTDADTRRFFYSFKLKKSNY